MSTSIHLAARVRTARVVRLESIFTFLYAGSSIQNASEQLYPTSIWNFGVHPTPQTKI